MVDAASLQLSYISMKSSLGESISRWLSNHLKGDPVVWGIVIILATLSILSVYSAASSLAYRQMQGNTEYYLAKHASLVLSS